MRHEVPMRAWYGTPGKVNPAWWPGVAPPKARHQFLFAVFYNSYRIRQAIAPREVPQPLLISPCPARVLPTASGGSRPKTIAQPWARTLPPCIALHRGAEKKNLYLSQNMISVFVYLCGPLGQTDDLFITGIYHLVQKLLQNFVFFQIF